MCRQKIILISKALRPILTACYRSFPLALIPLAYTTPLPIIHKSVMDSPPPPPYSNDKLNGTMQERGGMIPLQDLNTVNNNSQTDLSCLEWRITFTRLTPPVWSWVNPLFESIQHYLAFIAIGLRFLSTLLFWIPFCIWFAQRKDLNKASGFTLFVEALGWGLAVFAFFRVIFDFLKELCHRGAIESRVPYFTWDAAAVLLSLVPFVVAAFLTPILLSKHTSTTTV